MSNSVTKRFLPLYEQVGAAQMFLAGLFQSPARNFYNSEAVEIDILRGDEDISIVVTDLSTGYRMNSDDIYSNKEFKPPIHKEAFAINSHDLLKRAPGQDPFQDPMLRANVVRRMMSGMARVEAKIRRSVELQASQILQTGTLTLSNSAGTALYTVDFKPKTAHFPDAGTTWATATGKQKMDDIIALAEENRKDGLEDSNRLLMGIDAFESFISDSAVQARLDNRRMDLGSLPGAAQMGKGGTFQGRIQLGHYVFEIWTYGARYKDPQTGNKVSFLDPGKVVVMSSDARLDATFGAIPNIGALLGAGNRVMAEVPSRLSDGAGGRDMFTNVWVTPDGEQLMGGVGSRPLLIPTAIDTYGCLDTLL